MNQRIRELAEQSGMKECSLGYGMPENVLWGENQIKEFAQLIVAECAAVAWAHTPGTEELEYSDYIKNKILKHFGVKQDFSTVWNRK